MTTIETTTLKEINLHKRFTAKEIARKVRFLQNDANFCAKIVDRQMGCVTLTWEDLAKIAMTRVAFFGCGGLGIATEMLTRFGFGYGEEPCGVVVVDLDEYDLSNTVRQVGACTESIGVPKALYTKLLLQQVGLAKVRAYPVMANPDNVEEIIKDADIAFHTIDLVKGAFPLSDACRKKDIIFIEAWGMQITNAMVHYPDGPTFAQVYGVEDIIGGKEIRDLSDDDEKEIMKRMYGKLSRIPGLADCYTPEWVEKMLQREVAARTSICQWGAAHQLLSEAVKYVLQIGERTRAPVMNIYNQFTGEAFRYDVMQEKVVG